MVEPTGYSAGSGSTRKERPCVALTGRSLTLTHSSVWRLGVPPVRTVGSPIESGTVLPGT